MTEEEVRDKKKGGKGLIIAIFAILFVLLIVLGVLFFFILNQKEEPAQGTQATQGTQAPAKNNVARSNYTSSGPFFEIKEPFVVNLMGQNGRRYLKTSVTLDLSSAEFQKEVTAKLPLIQDAIVRILSAKTFEEVATEKGKLDLKNEIKDKINEFMVDGYIKDVLLIGFVVQ